MRIRPRRNRSSATIRDMVQETQVTLSSLITPIFLMPGKDTRERIASMPGIYRYSIDLMLVEIQACWDLGLRTFILFPAVPDEWKDSQATYSYNADNFYLDAIRQAKSQFPEICIITDVAMDPYSSDGHDGVVENGQILNDRTLPILAKMAVAQAEAGADIIGPSDMMDGRVGVIRDALDEAGFTDVAIMSYTAKYASAFYGPFRDALDSAPKFGDKKTYQMNPANGREAIIEGELDTQEGADYLMVKPALSYLDVIQTLKENFLLPIVAYNVSGEFSMVKAAAMQGWLDEEKIMMEVLTSIRRAGADLVITYFAKAVAELYARQ
ncbi:porphobilinogen synthase [Pontibacter sp. G13]|uniref:porphobilinogen synthase n=1 Tax=Pontibacter sp. G13 TaxID=3074898 RepID=UPI00288C1780|nr:porphobilinogen synthase [Pontibacter sp. G13]WNJ18515.1 porphobilinogen synthase [Pontibacter sp. G13]